MASEWEEATLGAEADMLTGFPFRSERYTDADDSIRLVRGDNIVQGALRWDGVKRWPRSESAEHELYQLREGDVVLAMDRPWIEAGLKYAAISKHDLPCLLVQRTARLRGGPNLDTQFLRYLIGSPKFTQHVHAITTGTAVPHISGRQIKEFTFLRPPLAEQRAIAHILGTLDDKIELNRRMSETLEAMARALFKSWFVDFDPVRAKSEGRDPGLPKSLTDLFPDAFADSPIGEIPRGWHVQMLGDIVEHLRDSENPLDSSDQLFRHFSIPAYDVDRWPASEFGESIKSLKFRVPPCAVLLSKLNPEIERVWLVDVQHGDRAVCSTEFLVLAPRPPYGRAYIYCAMRSPSFRCDLESLVTGTSKSHQRAQPDAILGLAIVEPPTTLITAFERTAGPLLDRTLECGEESRALAALRDALLPKLISGELRIEDPTRFLRCVD
ncbi:MAG: restriction endonuclease subunit S [bacterium]